MGILNNFMDKFKNAKFTVAPQKKLKTISADFKKSFDLTLVGISDSSSFKRRSYILV